MRFEDLIRFFGVVVAIAVAFAIVSSVITGGVAPPLPQETHRSAPVGAVPPEEGRTQDKAEPVRQLAYRLYTICERKGWAEDAGIYNALITSWHPILESSHQAATKKPAQGEFL